MASFVAGAVGAFVSVETYAMEKGQGGIKITLEEASWIGRTIQIENQVGEEALHRDPQDACIHWGSCSTKNINLSENCHSNLLGTLSTLMELYY